MHPKAAHPGSNALIASLSSEQRRRVLANATTVTLEAGDVVCDSEQPIDFVYFPTTAVLSVLSVMTTKLAVETAVVGYEGMAPMAAFHEVDRAAERIIVQAPGDAIRLTRGAFRTALADVPALRERLHHYSQAVFTFAAQSSACNRQHAVVERCARWLLTTHDRVPGDEFLLTHLFLSQMLGVRRSSITIAAEVLRAAGAISYSRGRVRVDSREILQGRSCECYSIIRSTYDRVLSGLNTPSPLDDLSSSSDMRVEADAELSAHGSRPRPPVATLDEFSERLREAEQRHEQLQRATAHGENEQTAGLLDELSMAFEQLHVAEEEMRVQMEGLEEMRTALETQQQLWRARFDGLPDAFI